MKYLILCSILVAFSCSSKKASEKATSENVESKSRKIITREEFGDKWPFTVSKGLLVCNEDRIVFTAEGKSYGVNGFAKSSLKEQLTPIEDIWAIDSTTIIPGAGSPLRKDIGPILDVGKKLCE